MTRQAFERTGGLNDISVRGSGDNNMALAWVGRAAESLNGLVHGAYKESLSWFEFKSKGIRLGYLPGVIKHYFHGSKKNRRYNDRWQILVKHAYNPLKHLYIRPDGLIVPSPACPPQLLEEIYDYFAQRNEDEGLTENLGFVA